MFISNSRGAAGGRSESGDGEDNSHPPGRGDGSDGDRNMPTPSHNAPFPVGYSSPTQAKIREELNLSLAEYSFFGSIVTIGAMIGAVTCGRIADSIGRKGAMRISSIFCIIGWLAIYYAEGSVLLDVGRFATGGGIGVFSYVVPVFIAEIAPQNLRGGLTFINQLFIITGLSATLIIGTMVTWRNLIITGLIPCIVLLVGLHFIPESPRWLAKVGHKKEFEAALRSYRGKFADISDEAEGIQESLDAQARLPQARLMEIFAKSYLKPLIVGVGLMVFQQFSGINGINFYASETFRSAGFSSGDLGTILMGCIQVPITAFGAYLMDKSGRRPLLMLSASGMCLGSLLAAFSFYLRDQGAYLGWVPPLALSGILVYIASFSMGMGGIPWVMMSEVFPLNMKGVGGSMVTLVNWAGSWVVSFIFNFLMQWSAPGTFVIFAAVCVGAVVFTAKIVPETKGRTLEEIQDSMN